MPTGRERLIRKARQAEMALIPAYNMQEWVLSRGLHWPKQFSARKK
jgi:hypothetical protein